MNDGLTDKTERTGQCLCGAVSFRATHVPDNFGICHCRMCRQWTGSALFGVSIPMEHVHWDGGEHNDEHVSSNWAKRGFCRECGSNLYFQFTAEGTYADETEIPLGLFDDPNGFKLRSEIYTDEATDSFAVVDQGHKRVTRADVIKILPILDSE